MWRALFLALGISACILGVESLVFESVTLNAEVPANEFDQFSLAPSKRIFTPPEWAPWSLLSAGAVVVLYSITLARGE